MNDEDNTGLDRMNFKDDDGPTPAEEAAAMAEDIEYLNETIDRLRDTIREYRFRLQVAGNNPANTVDFVLGVNWALTTLNKMTGEE